MTAWYETAFGPDYLALYPHRDDAEACADIASLVNRFELDPAAPLLDLCCGAGRHMHALYELGFRDLTGLDLSGFLLEQAKERLAPLSPTPRIIQGDMREIPQDVTVKNVLSIFTSFGYFDDDHENARVIQGVYQRLLPGGRYIIDTINPSHLAENLVPQEVQAREEYSLDITRTITSPTPRVEKTTRVVLTGGEEKAVYNESVRLYTADEFVSMFTDAGFEQVECFGNVKGAAYVASSPRLIITGVRPE